MSRIQPEMSERRCKQTYEVGDRVISPLGEGVILATSVREHPEGQMMCKVKHDTYSDHDGDTFDLNVEDLRHIQGQSSNAD